MWEKTLPRNNPSFFGVLVRKKRFPPRELTLSRGGKELFPLLLLRPHPRRELMATGSARQQHAAAAAKIHPIPSFFSVRIFFWRSEVWEDGFFAAAAVRIVLKKIKGFIFRGERRGRRRINFLVNLKCAMLLFWEVKKREALWFGIKEAILERGCRKQFQLCRMTPRGTKKPPPSLPKSVGQRQ